MRLITAIGIAACVGLLAGCSSAQDDAYKAQEQVANQRLDLIDKYQKCVKDAGGDQQKTTACDTYLKAADALK